jgi:hypothetical protein
LRTVAASPTPSPVAELITRYFVLAVGVIRVHGVIDDLAVIQPRVAEVRWCRLPRCAWWIWLPLWLLVARSMLAPAAAVEYAREFVDELAELAGDGVEAAQAGDQVAQPFGDFGAPGADDGGDLFDDQGVAKPRVAASSVV